MYWLGIDVGTGGTRALLVDRQGKMRHAVTAPHEDIRMERPLWAEQHPDNWWDATCKAVGLLLSQTSIAGKQIRAVGLSGQMHGLVMLDSSDRVVRPALIWCDQRSQNQVDAVNQIVGREAVLSHTANPVLTGFTLPKLLWAYQVPLPINKLNGDSRYSPKAEICAQPCRIKGNSLRLSGTRPKQTRHLDRQRTSVASKTPLPFQKVPKCFNIRDSVIEHGSIDIGARKSPAVFRMLPALRLDLKNCLAISVGEPARDRITIRENPLESCRSRGPDVNLPGSFSFIAQVHAPIQAGWKAGTGCDRLVPVMHPSGRQEICYSTAEREKRLLVEFVSEQMNVEITLCHQPHCVASNDVNFPIARRDLAQT